MESSNCITRHTSENIRTFQTLSLRNQIFEPLSLTYTVHAIETVILSAYTNFRSSQSFLKHTCLTVLYSWNNSRIVYTFHTYVMTYKQSHFCNTHLTNLTQIWTETQHAWGQFIHCCWYKIVQSKQKQHIKSLTNLPLSKTFDK